VAPTPAPAPEALDSGADAAPDEADVHEEPDEAGGGVVVEIARPGAAASAVDSTPAEPDLDLDWPAANEAKAAEASPGEREPGERDEPGELGESAEPADAGTPPAADADIAAEPDDSQLELPLDAEPAADIRTDSSDTPSFVRAAERAARWRSPKVRAALAAGCAVAAVALAGQWLVAQRDLMAARTPALKPLLEGVCGALGCQVQPPRALEALRVESSGVVRADRADHYRVSVALRNTRGHEVALPAFELALTDTRGQLIARRVLRAAELGARSTAIAPGAELALQCTVQVGSGTVAGYTIELFYP